MLLPSIKQTIDKYNLAPKSNLGQNFILDSNLLAKIVASAPAIENQNIIEIGPGPGGLTREILKLKPKKLVVIEKDFRCIQALEELKQYYSNFEIIEADANLVNEASLFEGKFHIISNLPYNIGTNLLIKWLHNLNNIESMTLMFQKEVADRIVALHGSKTFGRLSVISQFLCETKKNFDIKPHLFYPPPKVESSVVSFVPRKTTIFPIKLENLEKSCKIIFAQRRKMVKTTLKGIINEEDFSKLGILGTARPEDLSLEQICKLAEFIS